MGYRHEHILNICIIHFLFRKPRQSLRIRLESVCIRSRNTYRIVFRSKILRSVLSREWFCISICILRRTIRTMGKILRQRLLSAYPSSTNGLNTLSACYAYVRSDGMGLADCNHYHICRNHHLFNAGWHESSYMD